MGNDNDQNNISYENERNKQEHVYVGGSDASDMGFDDRDAQMADELVKEKKKKIVIALSAVILAVIVVVVYLAATRLNTGKSQSIKLVDTYMSGLESADVDKVKSVMDQEVVDQPLIGCHPCINTSSLTLSTNDVLNKFLPYTDHNVLYVNL